MRTGARIWMSPEFAEAGRIDVKTSSARNISRNKICEILRNSGNLEPAKNFPYTPASDCANRHLLSWRLRRQAFRVVGEHAAQANEIHVNHSLAGGQRTVIVITLSGF
jgi:hypothetical protein